MKKIVLRSLVLMLVCVILVMSVGCSNDNNQNNNETQNTNQNQNNDQNNDQDTSNDSKDNSKNDDKNDEPLKEVKIKVFAMAFNSSGIQNDMVMDKLKEETGIIVDWLPATGDTGIQKLQAYMAAGELPDVVEFHNATLASDAIKAGLVLPIGDKLDKLPNVTKNAPISLEYYKDTLGDGEMYVVGSQVNNAILQGELNWGLSLRWDLYKELGLPEIETFDDIIPLLKDMQALEPENKDGKKVYGVSLWPDWDGNTIFIPSEISSFYGCETWAGYVEIDQANNTVRNAISDDSWYKKGIKFYYDMNQEGLLDPDSLSQRFDNARSKYEDGRALMGFHGWVTSRFNTVEGNDEALRGFKTLYPKDATILADASMPIGQYTWGVGHKSKNQEEALKFINFWYDIDTCSLIYNGKQGEYWDIVDGEPVVNELGWEKLESGEHAKNVSFYNVPALGTGFYNEETGFAIGNQYWPATIKRPASTKLEQDYNETLGINQPIDLLEKDNIVIRAAYSLLPPLSDDINSLIGKIAPIIKEYSWKMIYANDLDEFESLWTEMKEKANGLGLEEVYQAGLDAIEIMNENFEKYGDSTIINYNK